jgi:hypothetical protein
MLSDEIGPFDLKEGLICFIEKEFPGFHMVGCPLFDGIQGVSTRDVIDAK